MSNPEEELGEPEDSFTDTEEAVLDALAIGLHQTEAAALVHREPKFVQRLLRRPDFRLEFNRRRAAHLDAIVGQLRAVCPSAIDTLQETMANGEPQLALRAAIAALTLVARISEKADLELRLSELANRLSTASGPGAGRAVQS